MTTEIISGRGWSWSGLALAMALTLVALWQIYRWMFIPIPPYQRMRLVFLRVIWTLILVWCLWEPVSQAVTRKQNTTPPHVVVMVDVSASMGMTGENGEDRWEEARSTVRRLDSKLEQGGIKDAVHLAFGSTLRPWREDIAPRDEQSLIVRQISEAAVQQAKPSAPNILFLISDGDDTTEAPASEALTALQAGGVRVFPVLPSRLTSPPPLARIDRLIVPQQVREKQTYLLQANLRLRHADSVTYTVVLESEGHEVARQMITHSGDGTMQVNFPLAAGTPGITSYMVRLLEGDGVHERGRMETSVLTRAQEPLRVLYVQGNLDWEYRFVRQAVSENPSIVIDGVTRLDQDAFLEQSSGQQPTKETHSAASALRENLPNSDVVVLSNLNPSLLDEGLQKQLLELVNKRGGGILFFSGNALQASQFQKTLLEELLPVTLEENVKPAVAEDAFSRKFLEVFKDNDTYTGADDEFAKDAEHRQGKEPLSKLRAVQITPEGLASEVWHDVSTNQVAISQPPPTFVDYARAKKMKPGAMLLGVHPDDKIDGKPRPLIASQNIGAGRSAFLGIDALWRWRMTTPTQARDYDRFWQQLFFWLGGRIQRTSIDMDQSRYQPGDSAALTVRTVPLKPLPQLMARDSEGHEEELSLNWNADGTEGRTDFRLAKAGAYQFRVIQSKDPLACSTIQVLPEELEAEHCSLNEQLLQQLARDTGGQCLSSEDLSLIPALLQTRETIVTRSEQKPLWHSPWIFAAMLACYGTELLLRRKYLLN